MTTAMIILISIPALLAIGLVAAVIDAPRYRARRRYIEENRRRVAAMRRAAEYTGRV